MNKLLPLVVLLTLVAVPSIAQKITIDYAHDFDFEAVKTFAYIDTEDTNAANSLMHDRVRDAIIREVKEGGLQQVDSNADLYITYHIATAERVEFNTMTYGYGGWGPGWGYWGGYYRGGLGGATTTSTTYTDGTLIIDAYEPADKKMVWRGTGTVTVKAKPEKQIQQVDKILSKMGKRWDKILKNQGK